MTEADVRRRGRTQCIAQMTVSSDKTGPQILSLSHWGLEVLTNLDALRLVWRMGCISQQLTVSAGSSRLKGCLSCKHIHKTEHMSSCVKSKCYQKYLSQLLHPHSSKIQALGCCIQRMNGRFLFILQSYSTEVAKIWAAECQKRRRLSLKLSSGSAVSWKKLLSLTVLWTRAAIPCWKAVLPPRPSEWIYIIIWLHCCVQIHRQHLMSFSTWCLCTLDLL